MTPQTKYKSDAYYFIRSLNPRGTFQETAKQIGVTYITLFNSFKNNRISYGLKLKIQNAFKLDADQVDTLNFLVAK